MKTRAALVGLLLAAGVTSAQSFDSVERNTSSAIYTLRVSIQANGDVRITQSSPTAHYMPVNGTATQAQLDRLGEALAQARFVEIPSNLPSPPIAGGTIFTYTVQGGAQANTVRGASGFAANYQARLDLIDAAIDTIKESILNPASFTSVGYRKTSGLGGATSRLSLQADGSVTVSNTHPFPGAVQFQTSGQATAAELAAISDAVRAAELSTIPAQLPVPIHIVAGDVFTLDVGSDEAELRGRTTGEPGYQTSYSARLDPLLGALDALLARVLTPPQPVADVASGRIRVVNNTVFLDDAGDNRSFKLEGALAAELKKFPGRFGKVEGRRTGFVPVTPIPGTTPATVIKFEVSALLNPEKLLDGSVQVRGGGGPLKAYLQGADIERVTGPGADVLSRLGRGRSQQVDGYAFRNANGQPTEVYVSSVAGKTTQFTSLRTRDGQWLANVGAGRPIEVLGLESGSRVKVQIGNRVGYLRQNRVEVGELPIPLHGPATGIVNALPNH